MRSRLPDAPWKTVTGVPPLPEGETHLWRIPVPSWRGELPVLKTQLARDELERADRFRFDADRERFIVGRALLRRLLGSYLDVPLHRLQLFVTAHGKPIVDGIQFNLAHSGDVVLVAFGGNGAVGVDVEQKNRRVDIGALAPSCFGPGELALLDRAGPAKRDLFFQLWARKEAWLKAIGLGLSFPLHGVDVSAPGAAVLVRGAIDGTYPVMPEPWHVHDIDAGFEYAAACALRDGPAVIRQWQMDGTRW